MSGRTPIGSNVFDAAIQRLVDHYEQGHRLVVSTSGGKDSAVCTELAIIAATQADRLPVDVVTRDEEIMYPGTYEYLERVAQRPEVRFRWLVAHQPIVNAFDRQSPYWWVFDPLLPADEWVRQPPDFAENIPEQNIQALVSPKYFPVDDANGQELHAIIGLRVQESAFRKLGLHSSGGHLTKPNQLGVRNSRPIYDWTDADVWLAIKKFGWDYNSAYDVMHRLGLSWRDLRISPPTMNPAQGKALKLVASKAWPSWWDRVCRRLPTMRTYAQYGKRAVAADRRHDETWQQCFDRTCIAEAPAWIAERASLYRAKMLRKHVKHAGDLPLPETNRGRCLQCGPCGSWQSLTRALYLGDPFSQRCYDLPYIEPEYFRPGAGKWGGRPSF